MDRMYSLEEIVRVARERGHSEEEIQRILAAVPRLKQNGIVKTSGRGASVGLTRAGARKVAELRADGVIPTR